MEYKVDYKVFVRHKPTLKRRVQWAIGALVFPLCAGLCSPETWIKAYAQTGSQALIQPAVQPAVQADAPLRVVVLPFKNITQRPEDAWLSESFSENITLTLAKSQRVQVVERQRIQAILREQQFTQSAFADADSAPLLGKLLGANKILLGTYQHVDNALWVSTRLVDVQTGVVERNLLTEVRGAASEVLGLQEQLNQNILQMLAVEGVQPDMPTLSNQAYILCQQALQWGRTGTVVDLDRAIEHLEKALAVDPAYGTARALLAEMLALRARYVDQDADRQAMLDRALTLANDALNQQADPAGVYRAIAEIYVLRKQMPQALAALQNALDKDPHNVETLVTYVHYAPSVQTVLSALTASQRNDPWIQLALGSRYLEQAKTALRPDTREALRWLSQARVNLPNHPLIPLYLAEAYLLEGQYAQALQQAEWAVALEPDNFLLPHLAAEVLMYSPYQQKVKDWLETSVGLNPHFGYNLMALGYVHWRNGALSTALDYFQRAEAVLPNNAAVAFVRAKFHFAQRQFGAARKELNRALTLWNPSSDARIARGSIYLKLGDISAAEGNEQEALQYYAQALDSERFIQTQAYLKRSRLYGAQGKYALALAAFEKCLSTRGYVNAEAGARDVREHQLLSQMTLPNANRSALLNDLGALALRGDDYRVALRYFEQALSQDPDNLTIAYNRGLSLLHQEQWNEAIGAFEALLAKDPEHARARYNLGLIYQRTRRPELARLQWQRVLQTHPQDDLAREALRRFS